MGDISIGSFSVPIGPGSFCLICHFHGGALSVSPFRTLTGAYQSSLVAFATGGIYGIRTHNLLNAIESLSPIGAKTPFSINKKYADLRPTNCLVFVYIRQVRRHGLSFGERPLTSGPRCKTLDLKATLADGSNLSRRIDYLQLSPAIQNFLSSSNIDNNSIIVFAIGLLVL